MEKLTPGFIEALEAIIPHGLQAVDIRPPVAGTIIIDGGCHVITARTDYREHRIILARYIPTGQQWAAAEKTIEELRRENEELRRQADDDRWLLKPPAGSRTLPSQKPGPVTPEGT